MRPLVAMLALLLVAGAATAQEPPLQSAPAAPVEPIPAPPPNPITTLPPPVPVTASVAVRAAPSLEMMHRWRDARVLSVFGSVLNVIGTGLSLASVVYIIATNYPPSAGDVLAPAAKPSDPGPALAYAGASASLVGFSLNAAGLGYEHRLLDQLGADPGRGYFGAGTTIGLFGFLGVGASYFFGLTNYLNPHDQGVAILATSITGTALCAVAGLLYSADSSRVTRAWTSLTTF